MAVNTDLILDSIGAYVETQPMIPSLYVADNVTLGGMVDKMPTDVMEGNVIAFPTEIIDDVVQPLNTGAAKKGTYTLGVSKTIMRTAMVQMDFNIVKVFSSWRPTLRMTSLNQQLDQNQTIGAYVVNAAFSKMRENFDLNISWAGSYVASGDDGIAKPLLNTQTGFKKLIEDAIATGTNTEFGNTISPITTSVITPANAFDVVEQFAREVFASIKVLYGRTDLVLYLSQEIYDWYRIGRFNKNGNFDANPQNARTLLFSPNVTLMPNVSMLGSQRLIMTYRGNMMSAFNPNSFISGGNVVTYGKVDLQTVELGMYVGLAYHIKRYEYLGVNDQA